MNGVNITVLSSCRARHPSYVARLVVWPGLNIAKKMVHVDISRGRKSVLLHESQRIVMAVKVLAIGGNPLVIRDDTGL
jgi:hypothetical protein